MLLNLAIIGLENGVIQLRSMLHFPETFMYGFPYVYTALRNLTIFSWEVFKNIHFSFFRYRLGIKKYVQYYLLSEVLKICILFFFR